GGVVAQGGFSNDGEPLIIFGKKFSDATVSILDIGGGGGGTSQTSVNVSETSWFVTFVQFSGDAEADSIYLWLNPDPTVAPSLASADASMASTALNDGFKEIFFRTEGGVADYFVDEIYFGISFESVAPVGGDTGPIAGVEDVINNQFSMYNYPNPFAQSTTIKYSLSKAGSTQLSIVNLQGQQIITLKEENNLPGEYTVEWDGRDESGNKLPTGIYFYRLTQDDVSVTKRLVFINR
ncbi:MAG: T9SS type A sorting domain-containing protein, partial [Bacteroidota bacterium]